MRILMPSRVPFRRSLFPWHSFDVTSDLPRDWVKQVIRVAKSEAKKKELRPTSVTSREDSRDMVLPVLTVSGVIVKRYLPWLDRLYRTRFMKLGQSLVSEKLSVATDQRYAINLNVQFGSAMRYECHVDSNPLEGILYATTHPPGTGGELVVSNVGDVSGIERVSADATRIYPICGQLVFFDARHHSHYVEKLRRKIGIRIAVTMNFYTRSCSEAQRPADLNRHLGII
jgi:hypothetical protein